MRWQRVLENKLSQDQESLPAVAQNVLSKFQEQDWEPILAAVRTQVELSFRNGVTRVPLEDEAFSNQRVNLDVAFWVDGELRASAILAENVPLSLALGRCTDRALHDGRFRPLVESELPQLRIEITCFGPWQRLTLAERKRDAIDLAAGYVACVDGKPRGWYLPMVHNAVAFKSLGHLLQSLIYEKGKLSRQDAKRVTIYTFPTTGCIETGLGGTVIMHGPLPELPLKKSQETLDPALQWILQQEINPGVFLPRRIPGRITTQSIDWPRLGFTASVLSETAEGLEYEPARKAAERILVFLKGELPTTTIIGRDAQALASIYAGLALVTLGRLEEARWWYREALNYQSFEKLNPIGALHLTKLALLVGERDQAERWFQVLWRQWERERDTVQLALYPELLVVANKLFEVTRDASFLRQAETIGDWYVRQQNEEGSFLFSLGSVRTPYIRGTGKILEVLALMPERYREALERGIGYIAQFQYTEENSYHIPLSQQADFLGGFRHDPFNREAWIDAAGHVVLALVRMQSVRN